MIVIEILLGIAAAVAVRGCYRAFRIETNDGERHPDSAMLITAFILALGFLGLLLK